MSLQNNCVIVFDQNEYGTYFTGQVVTGKVIITFNKPKKLKGIKLQICGYANCQWRQKHNRQIPQFKVKKGGKNVYFGREDYIATTTFLVGSDQGQNFTMDAGSYTYTFACPIPFNCPSSFEGSLGHIRYMAKVTFSRTGFSDRTQNIGFTVLNLLDLNKESNLLKTPANNESMENFCLLQSKPIFVNVNLVQTGYVPGQMILVSANVNNQSNFDCKKLLIVLNLRATYTSDIPCMRTATEKICLVKKVCNPVPRLSERNFAETIRVPATPPTSEHLSKVVRVSYEICVIAVMSHLMRNPKTIIPITIGSVPLTTCQNYAEQSVDDGPSTSANAMAVSQSADEETEGDEETEDEGTPEMPPPTYEEAMFMTTNIADEDANIVSETSNFTPRYPVFNVDEMAAIQSPPPNLPQKRRKKKKKKNQNAETFVEKPPVESPVQI